MGVGVVVGGKNAWRVRRHGDIVVAFHWVNREPAMVLFPARPSTLGASAFVVMMSAAFKYAHPNGYPTAYLVQQAVKAANVMGLYPDRFTVHRIADAILEGIEDLLDMPPEPEAFHRDKRQRRVVGEMTFKEGGKTIAEAEVEDPTATPEMVIEVPGMTVA